MFTESKHTAISFNLHVAKSNLRPISFTSLSNINTVKAASTTYMQNKYTRNILVSHSYLLGVGLCPLSSDTTIGPSSENGGLFLLIPLIPPHTSIIVSLVGPREPADGSQEERIRVCRKMQGLTEPCSHIVYYNLCRWCCSLFEGVGCGG